MGLKLGALAAGIGAGYMAADRWKKKKDKPLNQQEGMEPLTEPPGMGYDDGGYADGGLVTSYGGQGCGAAGVNRWMGKKTPK